eukprot:263257_1
MEFRWKHVNLGMKELLDGINEVFTGLDVNEGVHQLTFREGCTLYLKQEDHIRWKPVRLSQIIQPTLREKYKDKSKMQILVDLRDAYRLYGVKAWRQVHEPFVFVFKDLEKGKHGKREIERFMDYDITTALKDGDFALDDKGKYVIKEGNVATVYSYLENEVEKEKVAQAYVEEYGDLEMDDVYDGEVDRLLRLLREA